ncbi:hypothetical protein EfmAA818_06580 [Enterococcus faecium]|nr:hypothetical protein EfmAA818_06580 [Enterococcus faecium]
MCLSLFLSANVDAEKKTKFGKLAYFMSGIKQLASTQSYSFHVEVDGKKEEIESSTLLIGLTNSVGGFETLLPNAKVDDGKLHLDIIIKTTKKCLENRT